MNGEKALILLFNGKVFPFYSKKKKLKMLNMRRLPLLLMACAMMAGLLSCGGHGKLEKAVRSVLVSGDTTRAAYDSLC